MVRGTYEAAIESAELGVWAGVGDLVLFDGDWGVFGVGEGMGAQRCQNGVGDFCSAICPEYALVHPVFRPAQPSFGSHLPCGDVACDCLDDGSVLEDFSRGDVVACAVHSLGDVCGVFEFGDFYFESLVPPLDSRLRGNDRVGVFWVLAFRRDDDACF